MKPDIFDPTGKFTNSYASVGRNFQADARIYTGPARAADRLFESLANATQRYVQEKSQETPEQRLFKLEKEREINQKIAEDAAIFRYKPQEFVEKSQQSKAEFLAQIPEDQWNWANMAYEEQINKYHSAITANQIALNKQKQTLAFEEQGLEFRNKALTAAANGDAAGLAEYSVKWQENEDYLFNNGFISTEAKIRRAKDFATAAVVQQNLSGAKQIFGDDQKLSSYIQNIENSSTYTPEQKKSIKNTILSEYNSWHALNKVKAADYVQTADFGIKAYAMGIEPQEFDFDKTLANLKASGQLEKAKQLENAYAIKEETESFSKLSLNQMATELEKLKNEVSSEEDINRYKILSQIATAAEKEISDDPLFYAEKHGVIENQPLDITNQASINKRIKNAAFVQEKYGIAQVPLLKKQEKESIVAGIEAADAPQKSVMLATLKNNLNQHYGQFMREIAPQTPEFAHAGALFETNPQTSIMILNGLDVVKNQPNLAPNNKNFDEQYKKTFENMFSYKSPEWEKGFKNSLRAYIAADNRNKGKNNQDSIADAFDEAVAHIAGEVVYINGEKTLAPVGVEAKELRKWWRNLTDDNFKNVVNEQGNSISADKVKDDANLFYMADGVYLLTIDGNVLFDANDMPFTLRFER